MRMVSRVFRSYRTRVLGVALVAMAAFSPLAMASGEPTFDVSTLTPALYALGVVVLAGVVAIMPVGLVIKAPFLLIRIVIRAINRLFGHAKPAAA